MSDTVIQIRVPTPLLQFGIDQHDIQHRIREWLALSLFTDGHISSGKAASLLDIPRVEFLALLRKYNIAYVDWTADEIASELAVVESLEIKPQL